MCMRVLEQSAGCNEGIHTWTRACMHACTCAGGAEDEARYLAQEDMQQHDTNGDGSLDATELAEYLVAPPARYIEYLRDELEHLNAQCMQPDLNPRGPPCILCRSLDS